MRKHLLLILCLIPLILSAQLRDQVGWNMQDIAITKQSGFDRITFGDQFIREISKPELPLLRRSFVIPSGVSVADLQVQVLNERQLPGSYYIYPGQPPREADGSGPANFAGPDSTYFSLSVYPAQAAAVTFDGMVQGYHVITISYYPLGYIPEKRELYLRDVSVTVNYAPGNPDVVPSVPVSFNRASLAKAYVRSMVANPDEVELCGTHLQVLPQNTDLNGETPDPKGRATYIQPQAVPDYILITCDSLKSTFLRLAQWKTKKGLPAVIKTVEEIGRDYRGSDLPEKIRNFLEDAKRRWNGIGLFVLFAGDTNIIPTRMAIDRFYTSSFPADVYYVADDVSWDAKSLALLSNNKFFTSSFFGRIPVKNRMEAASFIDKLLSYEKANSPGTDYSYFGNSLIASSFMGTVDGVKTYMDAYVEYCKDRPNNYWYLFDHFNCPKADHSYVNHYITGQGEELNRNNLLSALRSGRNGKLFHFVYHQDHSWQTNMGASVNDKGHYITSEDVDNLPDTGYPKVILSTGCHPARFDKECIAEHFLNKKTGGAIAFLGDTDEGYPEEYYQLGDFLNAAFAVHPASPFQYSLGYIRNQLYNSYIEPEAFVRPYWRMHLLGDPETPLWTARPGTLDVTVTPDEITNGPHTISVKIGNLPAGEKAQVCVMKGEEGYATLTVSDRNPHQFTFTPRTPGNLDVTVTAHNFKPFETTIPVRVKEGAAIRIAKISFNDSKTISNSNNGDRQLDAGETVEVQMSLKNEGKTSVGRVYGLLSCNSEYIEILHNLVTFPDLAAGGTASGTEKFKFRIKENSPEIRKTDFDAIRFRLEMGGDNMLVGSDTFKIDVFASDPALIDQWVTGPQVAGCELQLIPIFKTRDWRK